MRIQWLAKPSFDGRHSKIFFELALLVVELFVVKHGCNPFLCFPMLPLSPYYGNMRDFPKKIKKRIQLHQEQREIKTHEPKQISMYRIEHGRCVLSTVFRSSVVVLVNVSGSLQFPPWFSEPIFHKK
jgi:hypothetical protein